MLAPSRRHAPDARIPAPEPGRLNLESRPFIKDLGGNSGIKRHPFFCGEDRPVGQPIAGPGWVRRSTAISCRTTSSPASLEADDRPRRTSQPHSRTKMKEQAQGHG
jgi:hypothetical protein